MTVVLVLMWNYELGIWHWGVIFISEKQNETDFRMKQMSLSDITTVKTVLLL